MSAATKTAPAPKETGGVEVSTPVKKNEGRGAGDVEEVRMCRRVCRVEGVYGEEEVRLKG